MRRTKEAAEETRRNLIRVGVHVFHKKSYAATRLTDIAEAAGVTRGAIYHHFGSKAELFRAVAIDNRNNIDNLFDETFSKGSDNPIEALKDMIVSMFTKLETDLYFRHFMEIVVKTDIKKELPDIGEIFGENKYQGQDKLKFAIDKGKEMGCIRNDVDSDIFAFFVMSSIFGIMTLWMENSSNISIQEHSEKFANFIFASLSK